MNWYQIDIGFVGYDSFWSYPEPLGIVSYCKPCHRISHSQVISTLDFVHPQSYPPCSPAELGSRDGCERHFFDGLGGQPRKLWEEFLFAEQGGTLFLRKRLATEARLDMKQCFLYEIHWLWVPGSVSEPFRFCEGKRCEHSTSFMDHP